jgi:ParB-like chromosome segregation protein Spo0J
MTRAAQLPFNTQSELAELLLQMRDDPEDKKALAPLLKKRGIALNDVENDQTVERVQKMLEADKYNRKAEQQEAERQAERNRLMSRYSPEEVEKIENDVMKKYGLNDYDAAAKIYAHDNPPVNPSYDTGRKKFTEQEDFSAWMNDPRGTARKTAESMLTEMLSNNRNARR